MTDRHDHHPRDSPLTESESADAGADARADVRAGTDVTLGAGARADVSADTGTDASTGTGTDDQDARECNHHDPIETPHAFPHPKPPQNGHTRIDWAPSVGRCVSARVRDLTCECLPTSYELCAAAGLLHIRRTQRTPQGVRISESPWLRTAQGLALWTALLEGRAR